jgi:hypothetical protein
MTMIYIPVKLVFDKPFRLQTALRAMQHLMKTTETIITRSPLLDLWKRQRDIKCVEVGHLLLAMSNIDS